MKKLILIASLLIAVIANAQSEKFEPAMKANAIQNILSIISPFFSLFGILDWTNEK